MPQSFEIFYADNSIVSGSTAEEFAAAPDDGMQFVIVQFDDGSLQTLKAQDTYEYNGVTKPGSWTDPENYKRIKASLIERSKLLMAQDRDPYDLWLSEILSYRRMRLSR